MTPQWIETLTFRELPSCSAVSQTDAPMRAADKDEKHFYFQDVYSQQAFCSVCLQ